MPIIIITNYYHHHNKNNTNNSTTKNDDSVIDINDNDKHSADTSNYNVLLHSITKRFQIFYRITSHMNIFTERCNHESEEYVLLPSNFLFLLLRNFGAFISTGPVTNARRNGYSRHVPKTGTPDHRIPTAEPSNYAQIQPTNYPGALFPKASLSLSFCVISRSHLMHESKADWLGSGDRVAARPKIR